ncbi:MAG: DUF983 domain-containing protein [Bacteroidetes bacterium]|nr:DUF983 domain-containing protein [Bacteroidota bacterium]
MLNKLKSSFFHKCPRCLEGDMYADMNPYHLKETANMYTHCPKCNLNFIPEPGYFYGAMYVSYAFTVAVSVAVFIAHYLFSWEQGTLFFIIILTIVLAALAPYTFRTSRAIWLNFFIKYDPELRKKVLGGS